MEESKKDKGKQKLQEGEGTSHMPPRVDESRQSNHGTAKGCPRIRGKCHDAFYHHSPVARDFGKLRYLL